MLDLEHEPSGDLNASTERLPWVYQERAWAGSTLRCSMIHREPRHGRGEEEKSIGPTVRGCEVLVRRITEQGLRVEEAAQDADMSATAHKWLNRYREGELARLHNRSSRPALPPPRHTALTLAKRSHPAAQTQQTRNTRGAGCAAARSCAFSSARGWSPR